MVLKILSLVFVLDFIDETGDIRSLQGLSTIPSNAAFLTFNYLLAEKPIPVPPDTITLWAHPRILKVSTFQAKPKRNLREEPLVRQYLS